MSCASSAARRRRLQIFDHMRLYAGVADEAERVARGSAIGIVIDDHIGRAHAGSFAPQQGAVAESSGFGGQHSPCGVVGAQQAFASPFSVSNAGSSP